MTKQEQVNKKLGELYSQLQINSKKVCGYNSSHWAENLLSHALETFLNMPIEKQYRITITDDNAENYITAGMAVAVKSNTSTFYRLHRRDLYQSRELLEINYNQPDELPDESEEVVACIAKAVETHPFYEKHLIKWHYYKGVNVAKLGRKLGIQPARLTSDIRIALLKIKKKCRQSSI